MTDYENRILQILYIIKAYGGESSRLDREQVCGKIRNDAGVLVLFGTLNDHIAIQFDEVDAWTIKTPQALSADSDGILAMMDDPAFWQVKNDNPLNWIDDLDDKAELQIALNDFALMLNLSPTTDGDFGGASSFNELREQYKSARAIFNNDGIVPNTNRRFVGDGVLSRRVQRIQNALLESGPPRGIQEQGLYNQCSEFLREIEARMTGTESTDSA